MQHELDRPVEQSRSARLVEGEPVDPVVPAVGSVERRAQPSDPDRFRHEILLRRAAAGRAPLDRQRILHTESRQVQHEHDHDAPPAPRPTTTRTTRPSTPTRIRSGNASATRRRSTTTTQHGFYALSRFADVHGRLARLADLQLGARHRARDDRHHAARPREPRRRPPASG